ncbi:MAG: hypothetical protein QNJ19_13795 [Woeseiaceae bacterium]|nr:hypothetical protein [Woeseiaceae bacterium]
MGTRYPIAGCNLRRTIWGLILCPVLAGCVFTSNLAPDEQQLRDDEAVFILGVRPRLQVQIWDGDDVGEDGWRLPQVRSGVMNHLPENGYIVFKLPATQAGRSYGLGRLIDVEGDGTVFEPCEDSVTPTFKLQAGAVVYAGDLVYEIKATRVNFRLAVDVKSAQEYLDNNYPVLAPRLVSLPVQLRKVTNGACSPTTVTIPM